MATEKMIKNVKLWNRGKTDYDEIVRGDKVFIKAGEHIVTGRRKAIEIRGHCCGKHRPVTLEVEPIYEKGESREVYINHKTGQTFGTKEALLKDLGLDSKEIEAQKNATKYMCPVCDKAFNTKDELFPHMKACLEKVAPKKG